MKNREKINILHIITNLELGGAQKHALLIIKTLDNTKYIKHLISAPQGLLLEEARNMKELQSFFLPSLKRRISPLNDLKSFFAIFKYIKQHGIKIVHTHSSKAGIIGRWAAYCAGVKVIIHTVHGWSFHEYMSKPLKQLYVLIEKITAGITSAFIAVSNSDRHKGLKHKIGQEKQYSVIHYGISIITEVSLEQKVLTRQELGIGKDKICVGMIACLKPQKNPRHFINLAAGLQAKYPEVVFLIAGGGALRASIEKLIIENKLETKVKLCGWRKDIERILAICRIVVLTSLWEGMPIALLEAMAFSKPVIAYASDGVKEMIQDGKNGYLIEPNDLSSLIKKVDYLLSNLQKAEQIGVNAQEFFSQQMFQPEYMSQQIQNLYQRCLKKAKI